MKIEITALVLSDADTGEIHQVVPVRNSDEDVALTYPGHLLGDPKKVNEALLKSCGNYRDPALRAEVVLAVMEGRSPTLNDYAGNLPVLGQCRVEVQVRTVEWPEGDSK